MASQQRPHESEPVFGNIYRTRRRESLLVLGVRPERICVEYADGRVQYLSPGEWHNLAPTPACY